MKAGRRELKYYISYNDYRVLSGILQEVIGRDPHGARNKGYLIRSLYFDDIDDKAFFEKMYGTDNRKKFRLRLYDLNSKNVKFEIKSKFNDTILKETAWVTKKDAIAIQNKDYEVLLKYKNDVLNKVYYSFKTNYYHPVVMVDYTRDAFFFEYNDVRVTFDQRLMSNSTNLDVFDEDAFMLPLLKEGVLIMEIKYNQFIPDWIKKLLQIQRFERCAISKYCISRLAQ